MEIPQWSMLQGHCSNSSGLVKVVEDPLTFGQQFLKSYLTVLMTTLQGSAVRTPQNLVTSTHDEDFFVDDVGLDMDDREGNMVGALHHHA